MNEENGKSKGVNVLFSTDEKFGRLKLCQIETLPSSDLISILLKSIFF